jgi:hypothetical protein
VRLAGWGARTARFTRAQSDASTVRPCTMLLVAREHDHPLTRRVHRCLIAVPVNGSALLNATSPKQTDVAARP